MYVCVCFGKMKAWLKWSRIFFYHSSSVYKIKNAHFFDLTIFFPLQITHTLNQAREMLTNCIIHISQRSIGLAFISSFLVYTHFILIWLLFIYTYILSSCAICHFVFMRTNTVLTHLRLLSETSRESTNISNLVRWLRITRKYQTTAISGINFSFLFLIRHTYSQLAQYHRM